MPWFDFDELHYQSKLPPNQEAIWQGLQRQKRPDVFGLEAVDSPAAADEILQSLGENQTRNEICRVSVRPFLTISRSNDDNLSMGARSGVDIYVSGYGSALAQGLYIRPDLFEEFSSLLTVNGLIPDDADILSRYRRAYAERMKAHNLEIMPANDSLWHAVKVEKVNA